MSAVLRKKVRISSKFRGPAELRTPKGIYQAVLPEPTAFEQHMRDHAMSLHLGAAYQRITPPKKSWWQRRVA